MAREQGVVARSRSGGRRSSSRSRTKAWLLPVAALLSSLIILMMPSDDAGGACGGSCCHALSPAQRRAVVLRSRIRTGMRLSKEAKHNITAAEEACLVWEKVLVAANAAAQSSPNETERESLAPEVLALSKTLYASCLVRVGRDAEAVAYSRVIVAAGETDNPRPPTDDEAEARLGAATCLLRGSGDVARARSVLIPSQGGGGGGYTDAFGGNRQELRLLSIALGYLETGSVRPTLDPLRDALAATEASSAARDSTGDPVTGTSTVSLFLMYRWILGVLTRHCDRSGIDGVATVRPSDIAWTNTNTNTNTSTIMISPEQLFLELIRINTSPLDDPDLVRLDDKIELHNLLISSGGEWPSYWPEGLVLPEIEEFETDPSFEWNETIRRYHDRDNGDKLPIPQLWISKSRSGYGSHGNRILTSAEANEIVRTNKRHQKAFEESTAEPFLLQRMVDPLVLLRGYKFSLRIYVVVFSSNEAYISSKGLVKLASKPLLRRDESLSSSGINENGKANSDNGDGNDTDTRNPRDPSMHMTNSGRETTMQQQDLDYLWRALDNNDDGDRGSPSSELWKKICRVAANVVLVRYPERISDLDRDLDPSVRDQKHAWRERRAEWGIPKILGLDFVVKDEPAGTSTSTPTPTPWLVEVNRFPGLEPRDEADRAIKYRVVGDAWKKALERLRRRSSDQRDEAVYFDDTLFDLLSTDDEDDSGSSLERLEL
eukprot:jgi/Psemu1/286649/fgenesh1_pg.146_\